MFKIKLEGTELELRPSGSKRWNVIVQVRIRYGRKKDELLYGHLVLPFSNKDLANNAAERIREEVKSVENSTTRPQTARGRTSAAVSGIPTGHE